MGTRHIVYMGLSDVAPALRNPKNHDLPGMVASLRRYGFTEPALLDERTGRLTAGHGRREGCIQMKQNGEPPPDGVLIDDDGEWLIPVLRGWHSRNDTEAEGYLVTSNTLPAAGGWYEKGLAEILEDVVTADAPLIETTGLTWEFVDDLLAKFDPETLNQPDDERDDDGPHDSGDQAEVADDDLTTPATDTPGPQTTCPECGHTWKE